VGRVLAPDSTALLVGLVVVGLVAMAGTLRRGLLPLRLGAGLLALVVVFAAGAASINVYFGYFTTWADVSAGLGNGPPSTFVKVGKSGKLTPGEITQAVQKGTPSRTGSLLTVPLSGRRSHINRPGLIWLPPQYNDPAYAHTRFPVVELIPGTPGQPADWISSLHVTTLLASLTASAHIGPMVVVMAAPNPPVGKGHGEECTNKGTRGAQDSTYMGSDVPADIAAALRVYPPGPHWAVAGYSSGGYCAVDLTLKHPGTYGAVVDLDGYLNPTEDGGLWHVIFNKNYAFMRTYDITAELALDHRQLPPFYLAAGTGNAEDVDDLITLKTLLKGRAAVTTFIDSGGHTFQVWRAELPAVFDWIWAHIGTGPTHGADRSLTTQVQPGR